MPHAAESPLRIRSATFSDIPRLVEVINSAFAIEDFIEGTRTDHDRLAAAMEKGTILAAEAEDGQLGACIYLELRGSTGYLGMLAVDPARQRSGFALRIVTAAEKHLRHQGCTVAEITVLSLRPELPPIYRRFGYVETGTEEFCPGRPLKSGAECQCIVMTKQL